MKTLFNYLSDHPSVRDWIMGLSGSMAVGFGWIQSIFNMVDWTYTLNLSTQIIGTVAGATVAILTAYSKYIDVRRKRAQEKFEKDYYTREQEQDLEVHRARLKKLGQEPKE